MKLIFLKNLIILIPIISVSQAVACKGEPPVAQLRDKIRILARAQDGLRLEGKHTVPKVISIKLMQDTNIALKIIGQAVGHKNTSSLIERMSGDVPRIEKFLIPNTLEIIPESVPQENLLYKVEIKDGSELLNVELLFEGGMRKSHRGCGGGKAKIEFL